VMSSVDAVIGDSIEKAVQFKHQRRLAKLGWARALEPPDDGVWAAGDPPPRHGCSLEVLIDGAEAFPAIARAIEEAHDFIYVTGWHVAPHFQLERGEERAALGVLLARAADRLDVRVLVWAGAPVPAFHPTRKEVREAIAKLTAETRIRCEADPREHPFHCHHEKTLVIDGELAFVGGIDITDFGGDRFDTNGHPARRSLGWHDVGARLRGPAVADVQEHFRARWRELTGDELSPANPPAPVGRQTVQVVRTVSEDMYESVPTGDFRILESYVRAIRSARHYIYLENQFLWAPEIVTLLADKLRSPPSDDFRLVVVLPSKANNGHDDTKGQLAVLVSADDGRDRLLAATLRSRTGPHADPLYVHAKVGIIDDRWLTVGSANLNAHSLLNDTEMNVVTDDAELTRATRIRLWAEHLESEPETIASRPVAEIVDELWNPIAMEQLERQRSGAEPTHRLLALPGVSRRSRRLLGPVQGLIDDG
jgi:phosphatidylserine/phosphatidylglycerophosphate/cardiolipin synthase-like enzyme